MAALFAAVLGLATVSADDDFFTLGGHPVLAVRLLHELRSAVGGDLELSQVLENPTPAALAAMLARGDDEEDGYLPIVPAGRDGALACTVQQEGLWFEHQLNPQAATYHIAFALRLTGLLDIPALQRALLALVVRHEALRTRFTDPGGLPRQVIDPPPASFPLPVTDITPAQVQAWTTELVNRPMDLAAGSLVRAALARTGPGEHVLVLVVHHIAGDGWSARIMAGELSQLYTAAATGTTAALVPLPIQPADHAAWQRRWLDSTELDKQLTYWRDTLKALPILDFPADRPRPAEPTAAGTTTLRRLPDEIGVAARDYARTHQVSFLAVLHAALLTVLHRWTGQHDLPIGSVFSGRTRAETEPLVGFFVNPVVLRTRLDGDPTFTDLIRRCHDTVLDATAHQDVPFGLIVDALQPERVAGRYPLFQISLTLLPPGTSLGGLELNGVTAESLPLDCATSSQSDMTIGVTHTPDGTLDISVQYSTELFDADRIERLLDHFTAALADGLAAPDGPAGDIDIMSAAERHQALHAGNPEPVDREPGLLHQVTAGHDPAQVAIRFRGQDCTEELSYGELELRANRLAHALRRTGVTAGDVVALLLDRGPHLTIAQFAVMKAGAAWMPADPQNPPARLAFQIRDAAARLVLTTTGLVGLASQAGVRYLLLDDPQTIADTGRQPGSPPETGVRPDDAAYLFYTSGSTGTPKGVLVAHRSAYAYCQNAVQEYGSTPADRVAQVSNPAFDASLFDCFATLLAGATMVSAPREVIADPDALTELLREEQVTLSYLPPTILAVLDPGRLTGSTLRAVFTGGEALPAEQVSRWSRPGLELHNCYGPTEATLYCISYVCPADALDTPPPIGTALPSHRAYVLDAWLRPVPIGVPGQLFIAGVGLAHGYLNRPGLTAGRFLADPFTDQPGERMYATGDLVRRRPDGILLYLGRTDRQVKLRGQRVELGEIEHALTQHPAVRQAVVRPHRDMLAACLVPNPGAAIDTTALREHLASRLPAYMIPARYLTIPELPLTPNGKLDTAGLPDPASQVTEYLTPRTPTEQWLAATWTDLLGVDRAGAHDNFFELGGNSLHITQLIARIRDHYDIQLNPRQLFTSADLNQLATLIDRTASHNGGEPGGPTTGALAGTGSDASLVAFWSTGTRQPLFLVHPVGGSVTCYAQLAQALGEDQPVYGIEDPVLRGEPSGDGLAGRAGRYAELIRRHQPDGPYLVGGWSFGGWIAHEMGRQLAAAGEKTAVFALDTGTPPDPHIPTDLEVLAEFVIDLVRVAGAPLPDVDLDVLQELDRDSLEEMALDVLIDAGVATQDMRADLRIRMRAFEANYRAALGYQPGRFEGPMVLITAADNDATRDVTGWAALAPALARRTVGGDHYTMLRAPHVTTLAATLRDAMVRVNPQRTYCAPSRPGRPTSIGDTISSSGETT